MSNKLLLGGAIVVALVLLAMSAFWYRSQPGKLDTFAQCLGEKGATFYGAFWCPHCQNQKALFGNAKKLLPYIECSTIDVKGQTVFCSEKGIVNYPTWVFSDLSTSTGELSLETLAEKTSCELPK